jgi:tetratricopeptide (TPR) repeat protein
MSIVARQLAPSICFAGGRRSSLRAAATLLGGMLVATLLAGLPREAQGQVSAQDLYHQRPYDIITVIDGAGTAELKTSPIPFPGRRVPTNPKPSDKIRLRLIEDPDREFELLWSHVKKIDLYEQRVLADANKLSQAGKLDEAYDYLMFLYALYPQMDGLKQGHAYFLYQSAGAAFRQQKYDEALAVLEELLALDPTYRVSETSPTLRQVLSSIADKLISSYVEKQDYRSARTLLARLIGAYQAAQQPFAVKWVGTLDQLAAKNRDAAREHLAAGEFVEAYDACRTMQDVWPTVQGGAELSAEIERRYPLVIVGVGQPALEFDSHSLVNPAARRAGRLVERRLMEFTGPGSEGGNYRCSLGTFDRSDDGLQLTFTLRPDLAGSLNGYQLSQQLLEMANPASFEYVSAWARLMDTVQVQDVRKVEVNLRLPHVLPQALLQTTYQTAASGGAGNGPYVKFQVQPEATRFTKNEAYGIAAPNRPAEIVERVYNDPQRALLALRRGEVDCLDQVFPGDIELLQQSPELAVVPYATPTTHVLIPSRENPFVGNRTFRRALLYGCNRELILHEGLLRGAKLDGYRVISAPFPAPVASGDSVAYGYDQRIGPRPYDARLAYTLRMLAERELKAEYEAKKQKPPQLKTLVLGHPADEVSRIACRALVKQWKLLEIGCELKEFPPGQFTDAKHECDLVYMQLATWEPIVDAGRLFSDDGLVPVASPFFRLTLRKLEGARNWLEARTRLEELHRLVHEDVTLIPLYQTFDYYAFRRTLHGLEVPRATLYQDVEQWQTSTQLAGE